MGQANSTMSDGLWKTKNHSFPMVLYARLPFTEQAIQTVIEVLWGGWHLGSNFDEILVIANLSNSRMPLTMRRIVCDLQRNISESFEEAQQNFLTIDTERSLPYQLNQKSPDFVMIPGKTQCGSRLVYPLEEDFQLQYLNYMIMIFDGILAGSEVEEGQKRRFKQIAIVDIADGPYSLGANQIQQLFIILLAFKIIQQKASLINSYRDTLSLKVVAETSRQAQLFCICLQEFEQFQHGNRVGLLWLQQLYHRQQQREEVKFDFEQGSHDRSNNSIFLDSCRNESRYFRQNQSVQANVHNHVTVVDDPRSERCVCGYILCNQQINSRCVMCWTTCKYMKHCKNCERKFCFNCKPLSNHLKCVGKKCEKLKFVYSTEEYQCNNCERDPTQARAIQGQQVELRYQCDKCSFAMCLFCRLQYYNEIIDKKIFTVLQIFLRTNLSKSIIEDLARNVIQANLILDDDRFS